MITLPSGRRIGPGQPRFIIAEVGSNWRTLDDCKLSIAMAKAAGADAVKFQAFTHEALYGIRRDVEPGRLYIADEPSGKRIKRYEPDQYALPLDWLPILAEKAKDTGIEFMVSAFSPELVRAVDPWVSIHKVASAELSHLRLLEAVNDCAKPVILSTGASGPEDIRRALDVLRRRDQGEKEVPVVLMYCVAAYPARDIDFRMLDALRERFMGIPVGFSDHTTDYGVIPRLAVEKGACVIEKHMTALDDRDTPDGPHSLTVDEFKKMVQSIRGERPFAWGSGEEKEMQVRHNRRLVATRDILAGAVFTEGENFGIYRSLRDDTKGLSGFAVGRVHGARATRAIQAGEAIGPGDVAT